MHIPDGVLSIPVLVTGGAATAAGLGVVLPKLDEAMLPKVALTTAVFFVASLVNVSIGPTSVHLVLSGLMGLVLGWAAIPAVFVGLVLQAVFFGFGGLTTLGVTTMTIALPGILWAAAFRPLVTGARRPMVGGVWAGVMAALSILTSGAVVIAVLGASDPSYFRTAPLLLATYLPLAIGEAVITAFAVGFLSRVSPDILRRRPPREARLA